jgi:hypothetical protein
MGLRPRCLLVLNNYQSSACFNGFFTEKLYVIVLYCIVIGLANCGLTSCELKWTGSLRNSDSVSQSRREAPIYETKPGCKLYEVLLCTALQDPIIIISDYTTRRSITINHRNTMAALPETYQQAVFKEQGAALTLEQVPLTPPSRDEILVKVEACGVCHSDHFAQTNLMGGGLQVHPYNIYKRIRAHSNTSVVPSFPDMKSLDVSLPSGRARLLGRSEIGSGVHGMADTTVFHSFRSRELNSDWY